MDLDSGWLQANVNASQPTSITIRPYPSVKLSRFLDLQGSSRQTYGTCTGMS